MSCWLEVGLTFEPRQVTVAFPDEKQAEAYCVNIKKRAFHKDSKCKQDGSEVSLHLPPAIIHAVASTKYHGFIFVFDEAAAAKAWKENTILWQFVWGSNTKLFITRDLSQEDVNEMLGVAPRTVSKVVKRTVGKATGSLGSYSTRKV